MKRELEKTTVAGLAKSLNLAFEVAQIDPAKDTIVSAAQKMGELGLRHLVLYIEGGGFLCLCSDAEMSARLHEAIERIEEELDNADAK